MNFFSIIIVFTVTLTSCSSFHKENKGNRNIASSSSDILIKGYSPLNLDIFSRILIRKRMIKYASFSGIHSEDWRNNIPLSRYKQYHISFYVELESNVNTEFKCAIFIDKRREQVSLLNCENNDFILSDERITRRFDQLGIIKGGSSTITDRRTQVN